MKIAVTGGYGFIGSNLIHFLGRNAPGVSILNIDCMTYAADPANLTGVEEGSSYRHANVDITDEDRLFATLGEFRPDVILHLAAESHVDNSIAGPRTFIETNIIGTFNILQYVRQAEQEGRSLRLVHVSTDEVYGSLDADGTFTEESSYQPNSPYSASKAAADHLVRAWHHTYGLDVVTTNCSNNFGPRQHREKLIPTVIRTALNHRAVPVYGDGRNVRDWLYVEDHCSAIWRAMADGRSGETYVIGTRNEWANIDLVNLICDILDEESPEPPEGGHRRLITFVTDRPGHDRRYAIDPSKIEKELGWKPEADFADQLRKTIRWYIERFRMVDTEV